MGDDQPVNGRELAALEKAIDQRFRDFTDNVNRQMAKGFEELSTRVIDAQRQGRDLADARVSQAELNGKLQAELEQLGKTLAKTQNDLETVQRVLAGAMVSILVGILTALVVHFIL